LRPEAARTEDRMFSFHRPPAPLQLQHRHPDSSSAASSSSRQPLCLESTATELSAPSAVAIWDRVPASAPHRSRAVTGASASSIVATRGRVPTSAPHRSRAVTGASASSIVATRDRVPASAPHHCRATTGGGHRHPNQANRDRAGSTAGQGRRGEWLCFWFVLLVASLRCAVQKWAIICW